MSKRIGIIIARFQVAELHTGHKTLIEMVKNLSNEVIVFLGTTVTKNTLNNPLDYETRKLMVQSAYPEISIYSLPDKRKDSVWSENLDNIIDSIVNIDDEVVLYGSRNSFKPYYSGKYKAIELLDAAIEGLSGTQEREKLKNSHPIDSVDYRKGLIASSQQKWPISFPTVDIAIFNEDYTKLLLAKKPGEDLLRFVGGFVDVADINLETSCRRECAEETGLVVDGLSYVGSFSVSDWRYKNSGDRILTTLFIGKVIMGHQQPQDDIELLEWVDISHFTNTITIEKEIMPEHVPLLEAVVEFIVKKKTLIELQIKTED